MDTQAHEQSVFEVVEPLLTTKSQEILWVEPVKQLKCMVGEQRVDSEIRKRVIICRH